MAKIISKYRFNYSFLFWFIFSTLTFIFFPGYNSFASTQVQLEWSPNSEDDLDGYKVFCREEGQSYDYSNPSWKGTETYCTIYDLDETKTYCFVARAYDIEEFESGDSDEVCHMPTVIPENQPPIANAGPDQTVDEGQLVNLNGSNSADPDDGIASYHWVQIAEPSVILSDPNGQQPTFSSPDVGAEGACLSFELTVTDHSGVERTDSCIINVTWLNEPPQADAGSDQTVYESVEVTLDASSSVDIDGNIASYLWTQTSGPAVTLGNAASDRPTFTAPNVESNGVSLNFNLLVTDTGGMKDTDSCIINITWQNEPPTAVVSPDYTEAPEGTLVTMDGSESKDSDDGIASYQWSQVEGEPVSLSDSTSAITTFKAPKSDPLGKNIKLKLTVKDHGGLQGEAESFVYVSSSSKDPNNSPEARFDYVYGKKVASFNDLSEDSDGTIVSWLWDFGDGNTSAEQNPEHRYTKFGVFFVTLTVTDNGGTSHSASKSVTVSN
jgi:PKD repeat protein